MRATKYHRAQKIGNLTFKCLDTAKKIFVKVVPYVGFNSIYHFKRKLLHPPFTFDKDGWQVV